MARASTIWVVTMAHDVLAAFTVKHELVTWLKQRRTLMNTFVQRTPDGGRLAEEMIPADQFIA